MEKAVTRRIKHRYPLTITDLTAPELLALTHTLLLDNPPVYQISRPTTTTPNTPGSNLPNERLKEAIKNLPCALRRNKLVQMMPRCIGRVAELCVSHKGLNAYVVGHLFDLVKGEVTRRLGKIDCGVECLGMFERKLLRSIQAIRRVWGERSPEDDGETPIGAPGKHYNKCEACMLARIVGEPLLLRNLRIAILSRTRTRKKSRAPRLLRFVEGCIGCHGEALRVLHESGQLAIDFKAARKAAARKKRGRRWHEQVEKGRAKKSSTESILVHLDPELKREFFEQSISQLESEDKAPDTETDETDEIISLYKALLDEDPDKTLVPTDPFLDDTTAVSPVSPLSPRKYTPSTKQTLAGTIPSRDMLDWEQVVNHEKSPLSSLARKIEAIELEGPDMSDGDADADALAMDYRDLIGKETCYSESEYSQETSDDEDVREPGRPITTWSLFVSDDEIADRKRL
ncbi:uncharacterized protein ACHE_30073S [Aspergillus chevalieri]|uniref:Uncharacterized protein n=1 Tax=Aspergillus chevalieri TaxID=182096 RepID=A0A7R7VJZ3_ASPCH|nr:uncharacterized protein ACHE_30073S [Aspergillus chevalieri]BCR86086.1 hypothetical protein ACHE_30073S [Aspergillus chevalieri]